MEAPPLTNKKDSGQGKLILLNPPNRLLLKNTIIQNILKRDIIPLIGDLWIDWNLGIIFSGSVINAESHNFYI